MYMYNPTRSWVGMMHEYSPGEELASATSMHHAHPLGVYQPCRVGMMHECSPVRLLTCQGCIHAWR